MQERTLRYGESSELIAADVAPMGVRTGRAIVSIEPEDDLTGQLVGERYVLDQPMGVGGAGVIYRATHKALGKTVAVKVLKAQHRFGSTQAKRFEREAMAVTKVEHPNVVDVLDYGETPNGSYFMAFEWLEGEDLSRTIRREAPFGWSRTKQFALQICQAVYAAHQQGILHRDLKPENCYRIKHRGNSDFIKVIDFGLAKVIADEEQPVKSLTLVGSIFGTPEYMAPEQARGADPDESTDVYALSMMLYEMLTGDVAFRGGTHLDVMIRQVTELPVPPSERVPGLPPELDALVMKGLAKTQSERFRSMRKFGEALAAVPVVAASAAAADADAHSGDGESSELRAEVEWLRRELKVRTLALGSGTVVFLIAFLWAVIFGPGAG